jgi:hypothetical protein
MVISLEDTRRLSKTTKRWHGWPVGGMGGGRGAFSFFNKGWHKKRPLFLSSVKENYL